MLKQKFYCPVCDASSYEPVVVERSTGEPYPVGIYRCAECNFSFVHPERYQDHFWPRAPADLPASGS